MNIRSRVAVLASFLAGCSALQAQSAVWKVTSGANTVYIGGTCHVLRPKDFPLPAEFDVAFAASSSVCFEMDPGKMADPAMQMSLMTRGMYTDGTTLEKVLSPAAWKALQAFCTKEGMPLAMLSTMKPSLLTITLTSLQMLKEGVTEEGVDMHYYKQAVAKGKPIQGLETVDQQLDFILNLGAGHESEMVLSSLEEMADLSKDLEAMNAAWRAGDIRKIDETMLKEMREKYRSVYDDLIVSRNKAWLPTIDGMLKTAPVELVLVGAAHLAGADGIIAELTKRGYKVEQIQAPKAPAAK